MLYGEEKEKYNQEYYIKNHNKLMAYKKLYHATHKEERKQYNIIHKEHIKIWSKKYHVLVKEKRKIQRLKRMYGMSLEEFTQLFNSQNNVCAICKGTEWKNKRPYVDHNHITGEIRGIICHKCNIAIGMIKEDINIAQSIIQYLIKSK